MICLFLFLISWYTEIEVDFWFCLLLKGLFLLFMVGRKQAIFVCNWWVEL